MLLCFGKAYLQPPLIITGIIKLDKDRYRTEHGKMDVSCEAPSERAVYNHELDVFTPDAPVPFDNIASFQR